VEAIIRAEFCEESAFGEDLGSRGRHEHFAGVECVDDLAGVEREELDAEIRVSEFGAADHFLNAPRERSFGLCAGWSDVERGEKQ